VSDVVRNSQALDAGVRAALRRHVLSLADSKRLLGIRYSDWLLGAPSIEDGIAASSMAQDEWGHARLLYAMLKDFDEDPLIVEHERAAEEYANLGVLDEPLADWGAVVSVMTVADTALSVALSGFAEGVYEPARSRVPKMLVEEEFHRDLAFAWTRRLASGSEEARRHLAALFEGVLPRTLAWLGPADEAFAALVTAGITAEGEVLQGRFLDAVAPLVQTVGVDASSVSPRRTGWDEGRGRGEGRPDDEAVARARGDLNRALLVE
jgi:phenylacetate-CoA oxygenase PaaI subunit